MSLAAVLAVLRIRRSAPETERSEPERRASARLQFSRPTNRSGSGPITGGHCVESGHWAGGRKPPALRY